MGSPPTDFAIMHSGAAPVSASSAPTNSSQPQQQMKGNDTPAVDEKKESPSADGYVNNEAPINPIPPVGVNGGMPPQQVYVNNAMVHHGMPALESQFHALAMNEGPTVGHHDTEGNGRELDEDQPVKLFVGQVRFISPDSGGMVLFLKNSYFFPCRATSGDAT